MTRVGRALFVHELVERLRDKWVLVVSAVFALLASGVGLYGRAADGSAAALTGPSLVTLASLLVPLVALILGHDAIVGERERNTLGLLLSLPVSRMEIVLSKFLGRGTALTLAVALGLGAAALASGEGQTTILVSLLGPTILLGLSFVSFGMLISTLTKRQVSAASLVVVTWFGLVFFYDLAILGFLVATDGAISQDTVAALVVGNPTGLYRIALMDALAGPEVLEGLGLATELPGAGARAGIWAAWILIPVTLSGASLSAQKVVR